MWPATSRKKVNNFRAVYRQRITKVAHLINRLPISTWPIMVTEKNISILAGYYRSAVSPFSLFSFYVLSVYKVSGEELDLSVITCILQSLYGKVLEQQNGLIQLL